VAAAFTSTSSSVPLAFASRPVSTRSPPNGQFEPATSAAVRTSELVPTPLQT
jgi:hypothetical protein